MRRASDASAQTVTVTLRSGGWDGTILRTATIASSSLGTTMAFVNLSLADVTLTDGTTYTIRVTTNTTAGKVYYGFNSTGTYAGGARLNTSGSPQGVEDTGFKVGYVAPPNTAPVITNLNGDSLAYSEGAGAVVIEQGGNATISDVDSADFNTGTLTVSFTAGSDSAEDVLSIRNQGTGAGQIGVSGANVTYQGVTIGTYAGGSSGSNLVITLNSSATPTAVTALVRNVTYEDTDTAAPTTGVRTVRFVLTDGDGGTSANYDTTVTVSGVNDAPVVDLNAGGAGQNVTTAFTEQTPVLIAPVGTLTDVDSANLTSLTVTLTTRPDGNAVESLSLNAAATTAASGAGLTVSYTAGTGVLSITGSATKAVYQSILQGIQYNDTSDTPTTSNRSITVVANDGIVPSATQTVTLTVTAVNDAPNIVDATVALDENSANATAVTNVSDSFTGTDFDRDGQAITYSITAGNTGGAFAINAATGAITVATSAALDFETTPSFTLTITASDGSLTDTAALTVNLNNLNETPTAGNDAATTPENTAVTTGNVLGNDSDPESLLNAGSITAFDAVSVNGGTVLNNGDGTFIYTPALNFTGTDSFTYTVSDGVSTDTATVTITVTPPVVNSPPSLVTNAGSIVLEGFSDPITSDQLQVTDAENTPAQLVYTVTTAPLNGRLELTTAPGVAITSFTQADINAGRLVYVHSGVVSTGDSFTFTVSDGAGGSIGVTTFNFTVTSFFPPPLGWPPGPGPASVPFTGLPAPPPVGVVMPVLPPPEPMWSPGGQNFDAVLAGIVDIPDEPAPREAVLSRTFTSVEEADIVLQDPSYLPLEPQSLPVKKLLAVGHNFAERLTKVADNLEEAIEERVIVIALSAGFMVWLLRRGSSLTNFFTSMLGHRFNPRGR